MPKSALIIAALAIHGVWTQEVYIRVHRQNRQLKKQLAANEEAVMRLSALADYLGCKLDEGQVELDEFDLIAIHNI